MNNEQIFPSHLWTYSESMSSKSPLYLFHWIIAIRKLRLSRFKVLSFNERQLLSRLHTIYQGWYLTYVA